MAINGPNAESAFIRKHNIYPLRPSMSSGLTPLELQTAMVWSHRNTHSERSLKQPISDCSLWHCCTDCRWYHCGTPNTRWCVLSVVPRGCLEPGLLEAVPSLDHSSKQSYTVDTFRPSLSAISWKENSLFRTFITRSRSNLVSS
ncbi:hypothetical protein TNCV_4966041 [Trichonephila clavipes]|nr:hypothetical protein TNCV_4966041 [Trichonephila clavipes]